MKNKSFDDVYQSMKLPPYGRASADRLRFKNVPDFTFVFCGVRSWEEAKAMQTRPDVAAMVLTPDVSPHNLAWPVVGCICIVSWNTGPAEQIIIELVKALLRSGSVSVTVWPRWVDYSKPAVKYDESQPVGKRWVPSTESIKTYIRHGETNVAR